MSLSDCVPLPLPWDIYPLELLKEMTHFSPFLLLCQKRKKGREKEKGREREKKKDQYGIWTNSNISQRIY